MYELDIRLGTDCSGKDVIVNLAENTNIMIAGVAGSGKTQLAKSIIGQLIESQAAQIMVYDTKNTNEYDEIKDENQLLKSYNILADSQLIVKGLADVHKEIVKRTVMLGESGINRWVDLREKHKDDPEKLSQLPWIFIVIEESAAVDNFMSILDKKAHEEYIELLEKIAKQGRSLGIRLIMISQRTTPSDFPRKVANEMSMKVLFKSKAEDLERHGMYPKLNKNESITDNIFNERYKAVFIENYLYEPIVIKAELGGKI